MGLFQMDLIEDLNLLHEFVTVLGLVVFDNLAKILCLFSVA